MSLKWTTGTVVGKTVWSPGLFTLHVDCPEVAPFQAGQFLQLALEIDGQLVHRPYSVASPAVQPLDFFIVSVEGGLLSPRLEQLEIGDSVFVSLKAAGGFVLDKALPLPNLWLFATGTGLAPYIALLRTGLPWQSFRRIVLVHGVRHIRDLAYGAEIDRWRREKDCFRFYACLSRETMAGTLTGRISNLLEDGTLEQLAGFPLSPASSVVMVCGNPAMLDQLENHLIERGLTKARHSQPGNIISERYW